MHTDKKKEPKLEGHRERRKCVAHRMKGGGKMRAVEESEKRLRTNQDQEVTRNELRRGQ